MKLFATKGLALAVGLWASQSWALQVPGPLVDTAWLAGNQGKVAVLDVRRDKQSFIRKMGGGGEIAGVQACGAKGGGGGISGHIPDSAQIEWKDIAVKDKSSGVELYDMVPAKADFEKLMQNSGVKQGGAVVIATPGDGMPSIADGTRLYWTLKYFGHDNVALLDGGVAKWASEKRKIEYGRTRPKKGDWRASTERREILATLEDVQQGLRDGVQLVDIRTPDYYLGLKHKAAKVKGKGHIPGAKNMPFMIIGKESSNGTTLYSTDELRRISGELGLDPSKPIIAHCNTGHLASSGWFVMHELLGNKDARLYVGSMNEWSADAARPVSNRSE